MEIGRDEVHLITGEIVGVRALVTPDGAVPNSFRLTFQTTRPVAWAELSTPSAVRLAQVKSLHVDMTFARMCCERLRVEIADVTLGGALWRAALVAYRRCFSSGARSAHPRVPDGVADDHAAFIAIANGHVAHQIDRFEDYKTYALGEVPPTQPRVLGTHVLGVSHFVGSDDEIARLLNLIMAVEELLVEEMAELDREALQQALSLDAEQLFSQPAQPGAPMSTIGGPTRTKPRRRR